MSHGILGFRGCKNGDGWNWGKRRRKEGVLARVSYLLLRRHDQEEEVVSVSRMSLNGPAARYFRNGPK
jgi:hypothetical protein